MKDSFSDSFFLNQLIVKGVTLFDNYGDHFHVCIYIEEGIFFFVMCTTSKKIKERIRTGILDKNSVIYLKENIGFHQRDETIINCNQIHSFSEKEMLHKIKNEKFEFKGEVNLELYKEILKAITVSRLIDDETKDKIYNFLR